MRIYDNTSEELSALEAGKIEAVLLDLPLAVVTARALGRPAGGGSAAPWFGDDRGGDAEGIEQRSRP